VPATLVIGADEHPDATYPLVIAHGHYSAVWDAGPRFDDVPPSANLSGYDFVDQQYSYWLYTNWTAPHAAFTGARALVITINRTPHRRSNRSRADHLRPTSAAPPLGADAVPFFDDSYAVDSANVGPYGAAIMTELLPAVEATYRGIGQARDVAELPPSRPDLAPTSHRRVGQGWARGVFGGSTGGWESFAVQVST
jgi:hypothetical protein